MVFVKSILAGLLSLIALGILLFVSVGIILNILAPPGTAVGIDIVSVARHSPPFWILAVLAFSLGFHWEYRQLKLRQAK
jgi:H+/Cl- antiporter ClcA